MKILLFEEDMLMKKDYQPDFSKAILDIPAIQIIHILHYKDKFYYVCLLNSLKGYAAVKEFEYNIKGKEYYNESLIKCPYCDYEDKNSWEMQDDSIEMECELCGSKFSVDRRVEVTYSSFPKNPNLVTEIKS